MAVRVTTVLVLTLAGLLVLYGLSTVFTYGVLTSNGADWLSYYSGAERLVTTGSPYSSVQSEPYLLHEMAWGEGFVYPPPAAVLLLPTLFGPATFPLLNLAGIVSFVWVSVLLARRDRLGWPWITLIGALALANPGFREVREGQLSPLIAAAVGAMWLGHAGVLSVVAGAVKVYPGLGLMWALRRGESVRGPLLLAALLAAGTLWLWPEWIDAMANAEPGCPAWSLPSIACVTGTPWAGSAVAGVLTIVAWRLPWDRPAFLLLTLAMIAPAPDMYLGYLMVPFVGVLPSMCGLLRHFPTGGADAYGARRVDTLL